MRLSSPSSSRAAQIGSGLRRLASARDVGGKGFGQSLSDYVRGVVAQANSAVAALDHEFWLVHMAKRVADQWGATQLSAADLSVVRASFEASIKTPPNGDAIRQLQVVTPPNVEQRVDDPSEPLIVVTPPNVEDR